MEDGDVLKDHALHEVASRERDILVVLVVQEVVWDVLALARRRHPLLPPLCTI